MTIVYTNADVLTKVKLVELREIATNANPDVMAITEVFPKRSNFDNIIDIFAIEGYDMFAPGSDKGRGVLLYVRKELRASEVNFDSTFEEQVWIEICLRGRDKLLVG